MKPPDATRAGGRALTRSGENTNQEHRRPQTEAIVKLRFERLPRDWSTCWRCGAHLGPYAPGLAPYWFTPMFGGPACWGCLGGGR